MEIQARKARAKNSINPLKPAKYVNQHTQQRPRKGVTMEIDCHRGQKGILNGALTYGQLQLRPGPHTNKCQ